MKCIELTRGFAAIVDDEDFDSLAQWRWFCNNTGRAARNSKTVNGKRKTILMHREIISAPDDKEVDHINGSPLDNRRCNLRLTNRLGNCKNIGLTKNKTGVKGVYHKIVKGKQVPGKFIASITSDKRKYYLGEFSSIAEAARVREAAGIRLHGEFHRPSILPN